MNIRDGLVWGLIPARGGSKSIPMKNLVDLAGRPMLDYQVLAARGSGCVDRLLCSTDDDRIAGHCRALGVEVHDRPAALADDAAPVIDAIRYVAEDLVAREGAAAEIIVLLQPTSPFLLAAHVRDTVAALRADPDAGSAQTVIRCPHNHHALNQRVIADGIVDFRFPEERALAFNKQRKPAHYLFGNVLAFRTRAALEQNAPFAQPSRAVEIPFHQGFDLDSPDDLLLARALLQSGLVRLPVP